MYACPLPVDETYLEFAPGISAQRDTGELLTVKSYTARPPGTPQVGNTTDKPLWGLHIRGFGPSSAVPGLVILSDTGVGREFTYDPITAIRQTGKARNLAGFVDSVSWTVTDRKPFLPRTSVVAQMNVPNGLFQPILFVDYGACEYTFTPGNTTWGACPTFKWSIDGRRADGDTTSVLNEWKAIVTTVRIAVVEGPPLT